MWWQTWAEMDTGQLAVRSISCRLLPGGTSGRTCGALAAGEGCSVGSCFLVLLPQGSAAGISPEQSYDVVSLGDLHSVR